MVKKTFAPRCSSDLFTLRFHFLGHLENDLEKLGLLWFMEAGRFRHFYVLINESYWMKLGRLLTRRHETAENTSIALDCVQRSGSGLHAGAVHAFVLKKTECVERDGGCLVLAGVCLILEQVSKRAERAEAAVLARRLLATVLSELVSGEWLPSFIKYARERTFVDETSLVAEHVRAVFAEFGLKSKELCSTLDDYDGAVVILRAWRAEIWELREQSVFTDQEFEAQTKLLNSFELI